MILCLNRDTFFIYISLTVLVSSDVARRISISWQCSSRFSGRGGFRPRIHQCKHAFRHFGLMGHLGSLIKRNFMEVGFSYSKCKINFIDGKMKRNILWAYTTFFKILLDFQWNVLVYLQIKLSDYRGKRYVVLFFYPLDFTFVCPTGKITNHFIRYALSRSIDQL